MTNADSDDALNQQSTAAGLSFLPQPQQTTMPQMSSAYKHDSEIDLVWVRGDSHTKL